MVATPVTAIRTGTCPHGLPPGACPMCNGGGGGAQRKADFSAKPGEMSWSQCAAIGAFLKAQQMARAQREADLQPAPQVSFQAAMQNAAAKTAVITQFIAQNFPPVIAKPVNFILTKAVELPQRVFNFVSAKFVDISDKLVALKGELKAALKEKTEKFLEKAKKLFASWLNEEDEPRLAPVSASENGKGGAQ